MKVYVLVEEEADSGGSAGCDKVCGVTADENAAEKWIDTADRSYITCELMGFNDAVAGN